MWGLSPVETGLAIGCVLYVLGSVLVLSWMRHEHVAILRRTRTARWSRPPGSHRSPATPPDVAGDRRPAPRVGPPVDPAAYPAPGDNPSGKPWSST